MRKFVNINALASVRVFIGISRKINEQNIKMFNS